MLRRVLLLAAIVALTVAGVSELFLPSWVARGVKSGLEDLMEPGTELAVRLEAHPSVRLMLGLIDSLTIEGQGVKAGNLVIDSLSVTASDLSLNLWNVLGRQKVSLSWTGATRATIRLAQADLLAYLTAGVNNLKEPGLLVDDGKVSLRGELTYFGRDFFLSAEGRFVPSDKSKVALVFDKLSIDGAEVGGEFLPVLQAMLGGPALVMDLGTLPVPLEVDTITMDGGYLTITGRRAP